MQYTHSTFRRRFVISFLNETPEEAEAALSALTVASVYDADALLQFATHKQCFAAAHDWHMAPSTVLYALLYAEYGAELANLQDKVIQSR